MNFFYNIVIIYEKKWCTYEKYGKISTIKFNTDENFLQTEKFIGKTISPIQFDTLKHYTNAFYEEKCDVITDRIKDKKINNRRLKPLLGNAGTHVRITSYFSGTPLLRDNIRRRYPSGI